ncbi:isotrichodermin C-15 hydroxylase [Xylaria sp. CBS 124048]|nr:isotrichodermin C-15 hydroxylase [Xylaria sp. CBS 124048]
MDNFTNLTGLVLTGAAIYFSYHVIYNLYFHPLAQFPGPLLRRVSRIPWSLAVLRGTAVFDAAYFHEKYGPVVRLAPNELAFLDPRAWHDIMGGGTAEIPKWIGMYGVPAFIPPHLQNTTSKEHHRALRKALSPGFSDASLRAQEPIMMKYIRSLTRRLREKSKVGPINMEMWYRYIVFDIICDLAFGQSFNCVEGDDLHPWIGAMLDGGKPMGVLTALNMYPTLSSILNPVVAMVSKGPMRLHRDMVKPMVEKRLQTGNRPDLINPLIELQDPKNSDIDELISNATVIIGAGAETSAGILTAVTSCLIDNPDKLAKLALEVRSRFQNESQVTAEAVMQLPYLAACINEALRIFPQSGSPSLRFTDKMTTIAGVSVPENTVVGIWTWALYRAPGLWTDPNEFHPERFMKDERYANDAREAFKPFFIGSRDCLGQNLAIIEMRLILAHMILNFDMKQTADFDSKNWVNRQKNLYIVWDKTPLPVRLVPVA